MSTGVILLNFGEPADPTPEAVTDYLARIFFANADLESANTDEERWARSVELAKRRAPGLLNDYAAIGGSPLNEQAAAQAEDIEKELQTRAFDVKVYSAMQYTQPFIADVVEVMKADGIERLVALPVYPLCGRSTNVMALEELGNAIENAQWQVTLHEISGWHKHPSYNRLRAEHIRNYCVDQGLCLDERTRLVFSAHGTPQRYIDEGSRYQRYVEEYCRAIGALLGGVPYELGYQNHANRKIEWTQPEMNDVIDKIDADAVVVDAVSFMHEQSETLAELDHEVREQAESRNLKFYRVPVPHDHALFATVLADLVEPFLTGIDPGYYQLRQCQCKPTPGTYCLNAVR